MASVLSSGKPVKKTIVEPKPAAPPTTTSTTEKSTSHLSGGPTKNKAQTTTTPVVPAPTQEIKSTQSFGTTEVIRMQQLILQFKEEASKIPFFNMNAATEGGKLKKSKTKQISDPKFDYGSGSAVDSEKNKPGNFTQDQLSGYRAIGNMIMNSYFKNKDHGQSFIDVDLESPQRNDAGAGATAQSDILAIVNSIGRIGTPAQSGGKGEKVVDGQWGPRTNNSLKLIFNVITSLFLMRKDVFGKDIPTKSLDKIKSMIPAIPPTQNIASLAKEVTNFLGEAIGFVKKFNEELLSNKEFNDLIGQKKGLAQIDSAKNPSYLEDQKQNDYFEANKTAPYTPQKVGIKSKLDNKNIELSYASLNSIDSFKKALVEQGFESWTLPNYLPTALDQILANIEG
jgi:hypothetical protein